MSAVQVGNQVVTVTDFGTVEGIAAVNPKVAIAIALRAYPAGKGMKVSIRHLGEGRWSVTFQPKGGMY